jgi:sensor histidine kinase YesM
VKPVATIDALPAGGKKVFMNDTLVKFIAVPIIAVLVVNMTKIVTNTNYKPVYLIINYVYFIGLAWLIWEGNVYLMMQLKKRIKISFEAYYKSILLLHGIVILYTAFISFFGLIIWLFFSSEDKDSFDPLLNSVLMIVVSAIFITNIYEIFYLNREQADIAKRADQLNVAKTHAELVALKNQIDPHFIFNSLNTLSYLISTDPLNARLYNDTLAKVYHYILFNREKNLVFVKEEIEFLSNFYYLLKIRFDKSINMIIEINSLQAEDLCIPPISLQILIENAIKHNELKETNPLTINVTVSSNFIVVKNKIVQKPYSQPTVGSGLNNLDNRYKLITGKNIIVYKNPDYFIVKLPVLNSGK